MDNVIRHPSTPGDDDDRARLVPHDAEAEGLVMGAVMHYPQAYADAAAIIDRTDIFRDAHRLIWDVVGQLLEEGSGVHPVAVRARIEKMQQLRLVDGGLLIDRLAGEHIAAGMVGHFAQIIADRAHERRYDEHATALKAAVLRGAEGDELEKIVAEFQQRETLRANTGHGPAHLTASFINWDEFFATDFGSIELLPGRLMAPGQQIAVVGDGKAGKSLLVLEWLWRMATGREFLDDRPANPVPVLYLDAENGQEQIQERLFSFGAGPGLMGLLTYASFPPVRPLDTPGGGADLMAMVRAAGAQVVVLDTISRFISGPENDADTWLSLYRNSLLPLKREGIGSVRLDHFGKDKERGGRGSSAKTQDVDHVWELSEQGGGIYSLKRTHTRTGIGPDSFAIRREGRKQGNSWVPGQTRHVIAAPEPYGWDSDHGPTGLAAIPGTVEWLIARLDEEGVPSDWGSPRVITRCAELGIKAAKKKIEEAVKARKSRPAHMWTGDVNSGGYSWAQQSYPDETGHEEGRNAGNDLPPHLPYSPVTSTSPGPGGPPDISAGQTSPGEVGGTSPQRPEAPPSPRPPSQEGGGGADPGRSTAADVPMCLICRQPLDPDRAAAGYDTHHPCPTTRTDTP